MCDPVIRTRFFNGGIRLTVEILMSGAGSSISHSLTLKRSAVWKPAVQSGKETGEWLVQAVLTAINNNDRIATATVSLHQQGFGHE